MNTTLQCLAYIEKIKKYFLKPEIISQLISNINKDKLSYAYQKLI